MIFPTKFEIAIMVIKFAYSQSPHEHQNTHKIKAINLYPK